MEMLEPVERRRTAFHEAGHAVGAFLVKRSIIELSIVLNLQKKLAGYCRPRNIESSLMSAIRRGVTLTTRHRLEREIIRILAGPMAEKLFANSRGANYRQGYKDDVRNARNLAHHALEDRRTRSRKQFDAYEEEVSGYLTWLWRRTERLLKAESRAVTVLAEKLLTSHRLTGREVHAILERCIKNRPSS